jgi:hypothetical protein
LQRFHKHKKFYFSNGAGMTTSLKGIFNITSSRCVNGGAGLLASELPYWKTLRFVGQFN